MRLGWYESLGLGLKVRKIVQTWPNFLLVGEILKKYKINDFGLLLLVANSMQDKMLSIRELIKIAVLVCARFGIDIDMDGIEL